MTTATDPRVTAIENSGWSRSFTFYQPRNAAFWVYLALVGSGALTFVSMLAMSAGAYGRAIAVSVVLFTVYGALFWWFTQHIDRYARQPAKLITTAFVWGAFAATWSMAANANNALMSLYSKWFGQSWAQDWSAGLAAPFTEEVAKGIGLVLLIALAPRLIRTAFDGFIVGAFLGLGFQIAEDIVYALNSAGTQFGANQVEASIGVVWMRMATGLSAHILYSAIFCAGLVYLLGRPAEPRRVGRGLLLMATAMLLHGVWDSLAAITQGNVAVFIPCMVAIVLVALYIAVRVFRATVPREREFLSEILTPEVASGTITAGELAAAAGDHKARKAFRKSGATRRDRRRNGYVLDAIADLADAVATSRGLETPAVAYARSEVARIRAGEPSVRL
ncbi:PrsW family intramembrane metalloprotease [Rhodococcus gannanensis]|uniref:PrsW family intramembrane metalloprotease n=1 Tax=Rhodococcus gannanensis TaxID=1960308 RepID=A0ABW4NZI6_9NOCA